MFPVRPRLLLVALSVAAVLATSAAAHDWNGIARDDRGRLFVVDAEDGQIWRIGADGTVEVYVPGEAARDCNHPHHLSCDGAGNLWLTSG